MEPICKRGYNWTDLTDLVITLHHGHHLTSCSYIMVLIVHHNNHLSLPVAGCVTNSRATIIVTHLQKMHWKSKSSNSPIRFCNLLYKLLAKIESKSNLLETIVSKPTRVAIVVSSVTPDLSLVTSLDNIALSLLMNRETLRLSWGSLTQYHSQQHLNL